MYGLFFSVEEVDERNDETADRANELDPIMNLHSRHLLPSRKKPTHQTTCRPLNITYVQKCFKKNFPPALEAGEQLTRRVVKIFSNVVAANEKFSPVNFTGIFLLRAKIFERIITPFY